MLCQSSLRHYCTKMWSKVYTLFLCSKRYNCFVQNREFSSFVLKTYFLRERNVMAYFPQDAIFVAIQIYQRHLSSGDAGISCKENWEKHQDSCFYWGTEHLNWTKAEEFCSEYGGHLASVTSNVTNDNILKKIASIPWAPLQRQFWIGASDQEKDGTWQWTGSSPWKFTNWMPDHPSNQSGQNCVLYSGRAGWNNVYCHLKRRFVCNIKLQSGLISISK